MPAALSSMDIIVRVGSFSFLFWLVGFILPLGSSAHPLGQLLASSLGFGGHRRPFFVLLQPTHNLDIPPTLLPPLASRHPDALRVPSLPRCVLVLGLRSRELNTGSLFILSIPFPSFCCRSVGRHLLTLGEDQASGRHAGQAGESSARPGSSRAMHCRGGPLSNVLITSPLLLLMFGCLF